MRLSFALIWHWRIDSEKNIIFFIFENKSMNVALAYYWKKKLYMLLLLSWEGMLNFEDEKGCYRTLDVSQTNCLLKRHPLRYLTMSFKSKLHSLPMQHASIKTCINILRALRSVGHSTGNSCTCLLLHCPIPYYAQIDVGSTQWCYWPSRGRDVLGWCRKAYRRVQVDHQ